MLYVATARLAFVAAALGLFLVGSVAVYQGTPHVRERVTNWLHPWTTTRSTARSAASRRCARTARATRRCSRSTRSRTAASAAPASARARSPDASGHQIIPDLNTDFIYSALAQELGLIGAAALLLLYMVFVLRGFRVALFASDGFSKLLAAGLTFGFALQTFIIVGGILRVIPLTGITLPLVSYGGSSIVANFLVVAGLMLVSQPRERGAGGRAREHAAEPSRRSSRSCCSSRSSSRRRTGRRGRRPACRTGRTTRSSASCSSRSTRGLIHGAGGRRSSRRTSGRKRTARRSTSAAIPQHKLAAQTIGYSTAARSQAGLERVDERLPHGREHEPEQRVQARSSTSSAARPCTATTCMLTIRPRAQRLAQQLLGGPLRRRRRDEPAHGRGVRDGVVADVRPEPHRQAGRLREGPEDPRRLRRRLGAAEPRDAGPLSRRARRSRSSPPRPRSTPARTRRARPSTTPATAPSTARRVSNAGNPDSGRARGVRARQLRRTAFEHSINSVFCNIGMQLGAKTILDYAKKFGFYKTPPLETAAERRCAERPLQRRRSHSTTRRTPNSVDPGRLAFGQERMLVTPLQMAMVAATIANGGVVPKPYVVQKIVARDGSTVVNTRPATSAARSSRRRPPTLTQMMVARRPGRHRHQRADPGHPGRRQDRNGGDRASATSTRLVRLLRAGGQPAGRVAVVLEKQPNGFGGVVSAPIAKQILEALLPR